MNRLKRVMNKIHAVATTAKSVASTVGATITSVGTGLAVALGVDNAIVILIVSVGAILTGLATWEFPYKPFSFDNAELEN